MTTKLMQEVNALRAVAPSGDLICMSYCGIIGHAKENRP